MQPRYANIIGWGKYTPDQVVTNDDLARQMDTSDEWIRTRSGIRERRFVREGEHTSTMAIGCARQALDRAGIEASDIDLILVATSSPDFLT
ncbi:MAG: 3-oxoacyl-ACP synthase, partial [Rhodothermaceae bacterium]|nr:3-oxoacyl-ACP synthase [Rhodothermaceae bacterium]